jgi:CBS domain-containing protein
MRVSDVMSTTVDFVNTDTKVKDVCQIIFGRGINGVPVCKGEKVVGFISERDILSQFFPSMKEYAEDPFREGNFEEMEGKVEYIFSLTAKKIMSKRPTIITSETPLLKAQSTMFINKVGRLPVVDKNGNLVGMITKSDIFKAIVGDQLPFTGEEEYHNWQAKHYDIVTDWENRLKNEIPDLTSLFRKNKIKNVVDIGFGTGEHDLALAKKGFNVLAVETSSLMYKLANSKLQKTSSIINKRIELVNGNYVNILEKTQKKFGAAIFMGNAFAHLVPNYKKILNAVSSVLLPKDSVIVLQIINFNKIFKVNNRVVDVNFGYSKHGFPEEHAFLIFYDPPRNKDDNLTLNTAIFDFNGKRWKFRSMNSTPIVNLDKEDIKKLLNDNGFKNISFYGGKNFGKLFSDKFDPKESDWLNVVAKR